MYVNTCILRERTSPARFTDSQRSEERKQHAEESVRAKASAAAAAAAAATAEPSLHHKERDRKRKQTALPVKVS